MLKHQGGAPAYKKLSHRKLLILLAVYYTLMLPILCRVYARSFAGVSSSDWPVIAAIWAAVGVGCWWRVKGGQAK